MPPEQATFSILQLFAFLLAFALLVSNAAAGLASGLAGSLAFSAAAVLSALAKIAGVDGLDMFHNRNLHYFYTLVSLPFYPFKVNRIA